MLSLCAETGTQYELGLKTDLRDGRIRSTLAVCQLTRDDVLVAFPQFPGSDPCCWANRERHV